ncbi:MAG: metal-dependent hydrolase [Pseudomonadota bacterium]
MDPVSQGVLGAAAAQALGRRTYNPPAAPGADLPRRLLYATLLGAAGGMAPDADILIRSSSDPLLALEYHRQFTHSLVFIPFGAAICALLAWPLVRRTFTPLAAYAICLIGYATHGTLDACTSYGTQLFWPFANTRIAWNNIAVVDPLFTLPALLLVVFAVRRHRAWLGALALAWMLAYLLLGTVQRDRALARAAALAAERGHQAARLEVKPSFANLLVWKSIYEHDDRYYVDAVRTGFEVTLYPGTSVPRFDPAQHVGWSLAAQQARDLERFRWFSDDFLAPTSEPHRAPSGSGAGDAGAQSPERAAVGDMRYSLVPNEVQPMWGISLSATAEADEHVGYFWDRADGPASGARLWRMILGQPANP